MKSVAIILSLLFTLSGILVIGLVYSQRRDDSDYAKLRKEATPIVAGEMTESQKAHSKIFGGKGGGEKIVDLVKTEGDVGLVAEEGLTGGIPRPHQEPKDYLRSLSCGADAVVVGVPVTKASQLTSDGEFVFTDYEISVGSILKNDSKSPLVAGSEIVLPRSGGAVLLNNHLVVAEDHSSKSLELGTQYLLFLKRFSPGTYTSQGKVWSFVDGKLQLLFESASMNTLNGASLGEIQHVIDDGACSK